MLFYCQPFPEKCISEVVRIGSTIIFHLSKLWITKLFILCDVIFLEWKGHKVRYHHHPIIVIVIPIIIFIIMNMVVVVTVIL